MDEIPRGATSPLEEPELLAGEILMLRGATAATIVGEDRLFIVAASMTVTFDLSRRTGPQTFLDPAVGPMTAKYESKTTMEGLRERC